MSCPSESAGVLPDGDKQKARGKGGACPSPSLAIGRAASDPPRRATRASALGLSCRDDKRGQTVVLYCRWDFTKPQFSQSSRRRPLPHTHSKNKTVKLEYMRLGNIHERGHKHTDILELSFFYTFKEAAL